MKIKRFPVALKVHIDVKTDFVRANLKEKNIYHKCLDYNPSLCRYMYLNGLKQEYDI